MRYEVARIVCDTPTIKGLRGPLCSALAGVTAAGGHSVANSGDSQIGASGLCRHCVDRECGGRSPADLGGAGSLASGLCRHCVDRECGGRFPVNLGGSGSLGPRPVLTLSGLCRHCVDRECGGRSPADGGDSRSGPRQLSGARPQDGVNYRIDRKCCCLAQIQTLGIQQPLILKPIHHRQD